MRTHKSFRALWGAPLILGTSSLIGLIVALLGDGLWDAIGWIGLGAPLLVMAWYARPPKRVRNAMPFGGAVKIQEEAS